MEPISTALAGIALVKASVDGIKGAIGTAKDIGEIAGFIDKLFEGEKQVQQQRSKKSGVSSLDGIGDVATEVIILYFGIEHLPYRFFVIDKTLHSIITPRGFSNLSHSHLIIETDSLMIGSSNG